jgi:hypothetical protein
LIRPGRRRVAIATVVGMLFMALIFLLAIGAQAYVTNAQEDASAAQSQAEQRVVLKSQELLSFGGYPSTLEVTNSGPVTSTAVAMLLKFENGTVYSLNGTSSPRFQGAVLPSGGRVMVQGLVPGGPCSPDMTTCLAEYQAIVAGRVPGRALGLVTSFGNTFWYVPSASSGGMADPSIMRTTSVESTSATNYTPIPGLALTGGADTFYQVQVQIGYWQSGPSPNSNMFAIGASNGTSFMFCGGTDWSAPTGSDVNQAPGNTCTSVPGSSLGPTWTAADYCNNQDLACEFVGTAYAHFGPAGGTLQMEFEGTPSGEANVFADSVMIVTQF